MTFDRTAFFDYLLQRLQERSTWLGFIGLATAAGLTISPELQNQIASLGVSLAGLILIFTKDQKK